MNREEMVKKIPEYIQYMEQEEKSRPTISQYKREIENFLTFSRDDEITKEMVIAWKDTLKDQYKASTVNTKLAAINSFFSYLQLYSLKVKLLRIQGQAYCSQEKELTQQEYQALITTAKNRKNNRLALVIQTIGSTGIRVSELKYITVEAVKNGEASIALKGKNRMILLPGKLRIQLLKYVRKEKIEKGPVFVTRSNTPLDRTNIWKMMKNLCLEAGVAPEKVFPHNLRHLFARTFYGIDHDIARLADLLGHSSINTTRIYIVTTGQEHQRQLDTMNLVLEWE